MNGIPARVVGGFAGGTWDASTSTLIFSGRHAHAWVEWWSADLGWQLADGTPAGSQSVELLSGFELLRERMQRFGTITSSISAGRSRLKLFGRRQMSRRICVKLSSFHLDS